MNILEQIKWDITLNRREMEVEKRIFLAVDEEKVMMFNKFERWVGMIEKEMAKVSEVEQEVECDG